MLIIWRSRRVARVMDVERKLLPCCTSLGVLNSWHSGMVLMAASCFYELEGLIMRVDLRRYDQELSLEMDLLGSDHGAGRVGQARNQGGLVYISRCICQFPYDFQADELHTHIRMSCCIVMMSYRRRIRCFSRLSLSVLVARVPLSSGSPHKAALVTTNPIALMKI